MSVQFNPVSYKTNAELQGQLGNAVVSRMQDICRTSNEVLVEYKKDLSYLAKGMWYADSYLSALQEKISIQEINPDFDLNINMSDLQIRLLAGYVDEQTFSRIPDRRYPFGVRPLQFILNEGKLASGGLQIALDGPTICDCGMACQIARYGALLDVLGKEKFDKLFSKTLGGQEMNLGFIPDEKQPMKYFTRYSHAALIRRLGEPNFRDVRKGQVVHIEGVDDYLLKKPLGAWRGINAICVNDTPGFQKFTGFGLNPEGESETAIYQKLLEGYNIDEDPNKLLLFPNLKKDFYNQTPIAELLQNDIASMKQVIGYRADCPQEFRIELIDELMKMPLKNVSMTFVKNFNSESSNYLFEVRRLSIINEKSFKETLFKNVYPLVYNVVNKNLPK